MPARSKRSLSHTGKHDGAIRASRRRARRRRARASSWRRWGARTVRSAGPRTDWPENAPAFVTHAGVTLTGSTIPKASSLLARVQAAAKRARAQAAPRVEQRWPEQRSPPHQPRFTAEGRPVAKRTQYVSRTVPDTRTQYVSRVSGTVRVCVRVCVCHGVARIQSTGPLHGWLSTGPRVALHGSTRVALHGSRPYMGNTYLTYLL